MSDLNELLARLSQGVNRPPPKPNNAAPSASSPLNALLQSLPQNNQPAPQPKTETPPVLPVIGEKKPEPINQESKAPAFNPLSGFTPLPVKQQPPAPVPEPAPKPAPSNIKPEIQLPDLSMNFTPINIPTITKEPVVKQTEKKVVMEIKFPEFVRESPLQIISTVKFDRLKYPNIQTLIDNSRNGTLIEIPEGVYNEEITLIKQIHLRGLGNVYIKGNGVSETIHLTSKNSILENLNITQIENKSAGSIMIDQGYTHIINCTISSSTFSAIHASNQARVEVYSSVLGDSHNPALLLTQNASAYCHKCEFKNSKTFGVLLNDNSSLALEECYSHSNLQSGIVVSGTSSLICKNSRIMKNDNNGIEVTSTETAYFENCIIKDHLQGTGFIAIGNVKPIIVNSTFINNQMAGIKASSGAEIKSIKNTFQDSEQNAMILSHDNAVINLENDQFTGKCIAALASFDHGKLNAKNIIVKNIIGAAALVYDSGEILIEGSNFDNISNAAFQFKDNAVINVRKTTLNASQNLGIALMNGAEGYITDCNIINGETIGLEVSGVTNFTFTNCQFSSNKIAGASVHNGSSCTFHDCVFDSNGQFGVDIAETGSSPIFRKCKFTNSQEAALNISKQAQPQFFDTVFFSLPKIGISIINASPVFTQCQITSVGVAGLSISGGATPQFIKCSIHDNNGLAAQIHEQGTAALFDNTIFLNHNNSVAILAINNSTIECQHCKFEGSMHPHCEIRDGATVLLTKCEITASIKGNGLQVHSRGILKVQESSIHDETKLGILVGDLGTAIISNSHIYSCGVCGILALTNSHLKVSNSLLDGNGQFSMQIQGNAEAEIFDCTIQNHTMFGFVMSPQATVDYSGNKFSSNGQKDILVN